MLAVRMKRLESASAVSPDGARHKTLLVGADGQPDDFGRDCQEILLELAHQHDRPFDQARHLLQQALVLDQLEPVGEGEVLGVGEDDLLAAVGVEDDLRRLQLGGIIVEAAHRDRARRMEAVAVGDVAGADAVDLEIDHHRLLGLRAEGADDRLQRPHPAQRTPRLAADGRRPSASISARERRGSPPAPARR